MTPRGPCSDPWPKPHNGTLRSDGKYWCFQHAKGRRHYGKAANKRAPKKRKPLAASDVAFVEWIKTLPCVIVESCSYGEVDFSHIHHRGMGSKDVPWIGNGVPMCRKHHSEQHSIGVKTFQRLHSIDLPSLAKLYAARWKRELQAELYR